MVTSLRRNALPLLFLGAALLILAHATGEVRGQWGLLGTFDPGRGADLDRTAAIGAWTGKAQSVQLVFTTFDPQENNWLWNSLVGIWNQGAIPIISWEPWFQQGPYTPSNIEVLIANGQYDSYITSWAGSLKNFLAGPDGKWNTADDRRAYIRFAHEMNGNWYPWSAKTGENSPADYVRMWKRVLNLVTDAGVDRTEHVQWIFSGICLDTGDFRIEQYWPGAENVDWIGLGGMNWGTSEGWSKWNSVEDLFADMVTRLKAISGNTKPFGITEWCTVSNGGGVEGKNNWLTNLFAFASINQARMLSYFNMDKSEGDSGSLKDWAIFGGNNGDETYWQNGRSFRAFSAYRKAAADKHWLAGSTTIPKRVEDKFFFGTGICEVNTDCLSGYKCSSGNCVRGNGNDNDNEDNKDNGGGNSGGSNSTKPTVKPTPSQGAKRRVVFSDSVAPQAYSWGSGGLSFKYNGKQSNAPEGEHTTQVHSTGWGGWGIFYEPNWQSFSEFTKIRFNLNSDNVVKLELQDSRGAKSPYYVPSTKGAWKVIELPLSTWSKAGVDLSSINGPFVTTMEAPGRYSVDDIQFVA